MAARLPYLLKPDLIARLPELVGRYVYAARIAHELGIAPKTLYAWLKRGKLAQRRVDRSKGRAVELTPDEELHYDFTVAYLRAAANLEANLVAELRNGQLGWQATAWLLERRSPQCWGRPRLDLADVRREAANLKRELAAGAAQQK